MDYCVHSCGGLSWIQAGGCSMSKRGSYLGGHTVINGGSGWFTGGDKRITSDHILFGAKQAFLATVIMAHVNDRPLPTKYPKKHTDAFTREVGSSGDVLAWAKKQPGYAKLLRKFQKRKDKTTPVQKKAPVPPLSELNLSQLMTERVHQQNVLRQQEFLINQIYRRIEEIDKAIANLKSE